MLHHPRPGVRSIRSPTSAGLALPLLALLGYEPGGDTGGEAGLPALTLVYCLLPVFFKAAAAALAWRWRNELEVCS